MNDVITSLIRTWVPTAVAVGVAFLVANGVELSQTAELQLSGGVVAVVTGVYYAVVRGLENKWPAFGYLLGVAKAPTYNNPGE